LSVENMSDKLLGQSIEFLVELEKNPNAIYKVLQHMLGKGRLRIKT